MRPAAIVLQARSASTRLPGKVLRTLGRHSLLGHCIRRLLAARVGPVIVATTADPADDAVESEAERFGCAVFRGSSEDVLARYVGAADMAGALYIVRATADNPAVDIDGPARLLEAARSGLAEYGIEQDLPFGAAVEVVAAETLRRVAELTSDPADREHVTLYLKRHLSAFRSVTPAAPPEVRRPDLRLTVDTLEDLSFMQAVIERADREAAPAPLTRIIAAADELMARRAA